MDFNDTPEQAAYRTEVRHWLAANAPPFESPRGVRVTEAQMLPLAKGWQARKAAAGYVGIAWNTLVGGRGGTVFQALIFQQEELAFRVHTLLYAVGMGMCIPTLTAFLPATQAAAYVNPAVRGDHVWCQLFSEPNAGSDLAGIRTHAAFSEDRWTINGQKVWTSYAHLSDYGLLLARTDSSAPKHKGLTMFLVDMRSSGVDTRPIRTLAGDSEFNEVFLTDVRIPDAQRIGGIGEGWRVALSTLMHERLAIIAPAEAPDVKALMDLARGMAADTAGSQLDNPVVRKAIARFYINEAGLHLLRMRQMTALSHSRTPGPESSIAKLVMAKSLQDMGAFALDLLEMGGIADAETSAARPFIEYYLLSAGFRLAGGTDEILRSVIAERVLGLPADIRVDKDAPFNIVHA